MKLLKLIKFNIKGILRDKGFLFSSLVVFPILFPLFMLFVMFFIASNQVKQANDVAVISKSGEVIGLYYGSKDNSELKGLLTSRYGHKIEVAQSKEVAEKAVKNLEASYAFTIKDGKDGVSIVELMLDKERNNDKTVFVKEINSALDQLESILRKSIGEENGLSLSVISTLQSPLKVTESNVKNSDSNVVKYLVMGLFYLTFFSPFTSSMKHTFYGISKEHENNWSYIPLLGTTPVQIWVASKVGMGMIWGSILSLFGLGLFYGGLSFAGYLIQSLSQSSADYLNQIIAGFDISVILSIWAVSICALFFVLSLSSYLASCFKDHKTGSYAEAAISTALLMSLPLLSPSANPDWTSYTIVPISLVQMMGDIVMGKASLNGSLLYLSSTILGGISMLYIAGNQYVKRVGKSYSYA